MKPTLVIAESDAELRGAYWRFLTGRGYHVETADDGLDCLEKLRRLAPVVLVLDRELRWGGVDGVLACLREESAGSGVSVVLTTTAGNPPGRRRRHRASRRTVSAQALHADGAAVECAGTHGKNGTRGAGQLEPSSDSPELFIG
jgi:CheY-like chemotaxis protein